MRDVWEFITDAGGWGVASVLAAVIAFGLNIYEHYYGSPVSAWALACVSVLLFWLGGYIAWLEKKGELTKEKERNRNPDLDGVINEALIGPAIFFDERGAHTVNLNNSVLVLGVQVWNKIEMDRISLKDWFVKVEVDGASYLGTRRCAVPELRQIIIKGEQPTDAREGIHLEHGTVGDVWFASTRRAHLAFYVEGLRCKIEKQNARIEVTLVDLFDKMHRIVEDEIELTKDRVFCGPSAYV